MQMHGLSLEEGARTESYLKSLAQECPSLTVAVQVLFGRCCLAVSSDSGAGMQELSNDAAAVGRSILSHPEPDKLSLDPLLLVEIHRMLRGAGWTVAQLEDLLDRIVSELSRQSPEALSTGRVRYIASQLAPLGYRIKLTGPSKEVSSLLESPASWFSLSLPALADLADHLIAGGRELDEISTNVLSLIALAELRNYRIDVACKLLRTAMQLGVRCPEANEGLNFIALQRRRDGYYGFSNQLLESADSAGDKHLSLYLPLTVNALWLFRVEAACRGRSQCHLTVGGTA
jgi:hypothetical protein